MARPTAVVDVLFAFQTPDLFHSIFHVDVAAEFKAFPRFGSDLKLGGSSCLCDLAALAVAAASSCASLAAHWKALAEIYAKHSILLDKKINFVKHFFPYLTSYQYV